MGVGQPEALAFRDELIRQRPDIPGAQVFLEWESANTTENIQFSLKKFGFLKTIKKAIIVANPARMRRVYLACRKNLPGVKLLNCPPESDFEKEMQAFQDKNLIYQAIVI